MSFDPQDPGTWGASEQDMKAFRRYERREAAISLIGYAIIVLLGVAVGLYFGVGP